MPAFDLVAAARRVMVENGFVLDLPPADVRDLRALPWSSIDNAESRDLDQIEVVLDDDRVLVGIADVDDLVPRGSRLDAHAALNTATIYTGAAVFPMLPVAFSNDATSLLPGVDRLAVVIEVTVDAAGSVAAEDVYRARVHNHAKLEYDAVGAWLEGAGSRSIAPREIEEQLRAQDAIARRLRTRRYEHGALDLETLEANLVVRQDKAALEVTKKNAARDLIEDFMIAANGAMARFLDLRKRSSLRRVVRTPERWGRIVELARSFGEELPVEPSARALSAFLDKRKRAAPERFGDLSLAVVKLMGPGEYVLDRAGADRDGHFGLAVQDYTHSTAPNRRFADLVTQRVLKAALANEPPPYTDEEIAAIAARCNDREHAARKVERTTRKMGTALLLSDRIGHVFDAFVTGVTPSGTFVRVVDPPAEGRVVKGESGLDVGDAVRVKLVATEPSRGFIDFVRA